MEKHGELKTDITPCVHCGRPSIIIMDGDPVCGEHYDKHSKEATACAGENDTMDRAVSAHVDHHAETKACKD